MPAKDIFHDTVINALIKEEWTIISCWLFMRRINGLIPILRQDNGFLLMVCH
ncbi:MAG: hypothetical protein GY862_37870 [Gammaproteobacteria bacterium]|nr:hypothetical protein [Gammaproteobacteria bacterium]